MVDVKISQNISTKDFRNIFSRLTGCFLFKFGQVLVSSLRFKKPKLITQTEKAAANTCAVSSVNTNLLNKNLVCFVWSVRQSC